MTKGERKALPRLFLFLFPLCLLSFQQIQYHIWRHLHLCYSAKAGTHILDTCTHQVHIIINNQETVMGFMGQLYEHHSIVLLIVLLQIQLELFAVEAGHDL